MSKRSQYEGKKSSAPVAAPTLQRKCECGQHTGGGECEACRKQKDEQQLQRSAVNQESVNRVPPIVQDVLHSSGKPLDSETRTFFEPRMDHDFSNVRVHTDQKASESASQVKARAYTVGQHIVFGTGQYTPQASSGKELLAHELTHVTQQSEVDQPAADLRIGEAGSSLETAADHASSQVVSGLSVSSSPAKSTSKVLSRDPQPACAKTYAPATSFRELIDLVVAAEAKMSAAGITSVTDQIHALRGVYYGTTWGRDFTGVPGAPGQGSTLRNEGFQRFTRPSATDPLKTAPPDVTNIFDCGLLDALKQSQDAQEPTTKRHVDFGHLIIGLDARNDPNLTRNVTFPDPILGFPIDMGGTGTELVTWVGDLGGGTANLAILRVLKSKTENVSSSFKGSDYGGSINLEGDIAGFVVATSSTTAVTAPTFTPGQKVSDVLRDYLTPAAATPGTAWKDRACTFLKMYGATFDAAGNLTNRATLVTAFATKFQTFACNYLASRVKDKRISASTGVAASDHVVPASQEVAETFIDALDDSRKTGGKIEATRFPTPKAAQPGACTVQIQAARALSIFPGGGGGGED